MGYVWVLIPIVAILAGTISEVIKSRDKQRALGSSSQELEGEVKALKQAIAEQKEAYERRLANLETIVTSQTWDVLQNPQLSESDKRFLTANTASAQAPLDDERRAELLAQKLK